MQNQIKRQIESCINLYINFYHKEEKFQETVELISQNEKYFLRPLFKKPKEISKEQYECLINDSKGDKRTNEYFLQTEQSYNDFFDKYYN